MEKCVTKCRTKGEIAKKRQASINKQNREKIKKIEGEKQNLQDSNVNLKFTVNALNSAMKTMNKELQLLRVVNEQNDKKLFSIHQLLGRVAEGNLSAPTGVALALSVHEGVNPHETALMVMSLEDSSMNKNNIKKE